MPQPGTRSHSPLRAAGPARLLHLVPGRCPRVRLRRRRGPSVPVRRGCAGRSAVRVSWLGCAGCVEPSGSGGRAAAPPSPLRASALLVPRLPRRGCQPCAPRPAPALPAPAARGAHWAKGPGCLRSPLSRARPSPAPPPRPATHALAASQPPPRLQLISILTVTVAGGGAAGGAQDPRRRRAAVRPRRGGGVGGRAEPPSARGSASFFFLFSLCLLQDLKGQPRPRRGARRLPFLRSPDALCGPAGPAGTRGTGSRPPGIFRSTPGPGHRGGRAWLGRPGARLFLQSPIGGGNKTTQQLLFQPKVGSKESGREVSQMLSEFQRAQKYTSPTRETAGAQHSRAPKSLRASPPWRPLRRRAPNRSPARVPRKLHSACQGPASGHPSLAWTAWKAAFRSIQSPSYAAKGRALEGLDSTRSLQAPPPRILYPLESLGGKRSKRRAVMDSAKGPSEGRGGGLGPGAKA